MTSASLERVSARAADILPPVTLVTCTAFLVLKSSLSVHALLTLHVVAVSTLGAFLLIAEVLLLVIWRRESSAQDVPVILLRVATDILPAPAALVILLTGLDLVRVIPSDSPSAAPWIFTMLIIFGVMFADGIWGFSPAVSNTRSASAARRGHHLWSRAELATLHIHCLSFPLVLLLPLFHPRSLPVFPAAVDAALAVRLTAQQRSVIEALAIVAGVIVIVLALRARSRRSLKLQVA